MKKGNPRDFLVSPITGQNVLTPDLPLTLADMQLGLYLLKKIAASSQQEQTLIQDAQVLLKQASDAFPNGISLQDIAIAGGVTGSDPMLLHVHADGTVHASNVVINLPSSTAGDQLPVDQRINGQLSFREDL